MTSLNPSHNPFKQSEGRHAQAIHQPSTEDVDDKPSSSVFPSKLPLNPSTSDDEYEKAEKKGRREGRRRIRNAIPPMPDLRFEQSYLLSIRPFLRPRPDMETVTEKGPGPVDGEKQTGSLVESSERDDVFHWGREVEVDWRMVSWITLRDQLLSPLAQGIFWGFGTLFLGSASAYLRASLYPASHIPRGRLTGGSGGSTSQAGGGGAVGNADGWWRGFVKSWSGAVETAVA